MDKEKPDRENDSRSGFIVYYSEGNACLAQLFLVDAEAFVDLAFGAFHLRSDLGIVLELVMAVHKLDPGLGAGVQEGISEQDIDAFSAIGFFDRTHVEIEDLHVL